MWPWNKEEKKYCAKTGEECGDSGEEEEEKEIEYVREKTKEETITVKKVRIYWRDGRTEELKYSYRLYDPVSEDYSSPQDIYIHDTDNPELHGDKSGVSIPEEYAGRKINSAHIAEIEEIWVKIYKYSVDLVKTKYKDSGYDYTQKSKIRRRVSETRYDKK